MKQAKGKPAIRLGLNLSAKGPEVFLYNPRYGTRQNYINRPVRWGFAPRVSTINYRRIR